MPITVAQLDTLVDDYDWDAFETKVADALGDGYKSIAIEQAQREANKYADFDDFNVNDPFVDKFFTNYLAERVTQISETTRDLLRSELQASFADGDADTHQELAGRLREAVGDSAAFSPARGLTVARAEAAFAYGHGAGLAFKQNGVENVVISDGDGDEDCEAADGAVWTVDEYLAEPIAHPNCVRSAAPADETDT